MYNLGYIYRRKKIINGYYSIIQGYVGCHATLINKKQRKRKEFMVQFKMKNVISKNNLHVHNIRYVISNITNKQFQLHFVKINYKSQFAF